MKHLIQISKVNIYMYYMQKRRLYSRVYSMTTW